MKTRAILLIASTLLALAATTASAGNQEGQFYLSPMIGGISFDGKQHLETGPVFGARVGYNLSKEVGFEGLFDYASSKGTLTGNKVDFYRYGGEALYHFIPDNTLVPYIAAGFSGVTFKNDTASDSADHARGAFDYGVGAKYFFNDNMALRGDVRHIIYAHEQTLQAIEYTVGLYIPFGGVTPAAKAVEPTPAPAPAAVAPAPEPARVEAPSPPAPVASLSVTPSSITKGQSTTLAWTSQNATDCDIQPGIGPVQPQGSMGITPLDNTGYTLKCTGPGGATTSTAAITVLVPPPPAPAPPAPTHVLCKPTVIDIQFDTNKADIKPKYHEELKKLGDFLKEFPNAKGTIEGHTDSVGTKAANMKLSQRRAESVRNYLIKNFDIAPNRISAKGYGPTKPIADNKTAAGRQKNRRIEANFSCD